MFNSAFKHLTLENDHEGVECKVLRVKGYVKVINLTRCQINHKVNTPKANAKLQVSSTFPKLRRNMAIVPGRGYLIF